VERAVVLAGPSGLEFQFEPTHEDKSLRREYSQATGTESALELSPADELRVRRAESERVTILKALEHSRWNKTQTAVALGISRRSLLYKIKEYAIS
jgi:DNA-binding NtrC family response regulator